MFAGWQTQRVAYVVAYMMGCGLDRNLKLETMAAATLTEKGQIVIPANIRARYGLTPGTQLEFIDDGGILRLIVKRRVDPTDPAMGYGLVQIPSSGRTRRLRDFDAADVVTRTRHESK